MSYLQRYDHRRVLVTGGGSGIGQATVLRILDEGGQAVAADADFSLFAKASPALPLPEGAIFAGPDAVAAVVAMLGSADAYFVTGTEVRIDGGSHM